MSVLLKNLNRRGQNGRKRWKEFCELHTDPKCPSLNEWERLNKINKVFQISPKSSNFGMERLKFQCSGRTQS